MVIDERAHGNCCLPVSPVRVRVRVFRGHSCVVRAGPLPLAHTTGGQP